MRIVFFCTCEISRCLLGVVCRDTDQKRATGAVLSFYLPDRRNTVIMGLNLCRFVHFFKSDGFKKFYGFILYPGSDTLEFIRGKHSKHFLIVQGKDLKHSPAEAMRLAGISSRTLYKKMNSGALSYTIGVNGRRQIETAELLRVYPDITIDVNTVNSSDVNESKDMETLSEGPLLELMKAILQQLEQLNQEVKELKALPPPPAPTKPPKPKAKPSKDKKLTFGDLASRFDR